MSDVPLGQGGGAPSGLGDEAGRGGFTEVSLPLTGPAPTRTEPETETEAEAEAEAIVHERPAAPDVVGSPGPVPAAPVAGSATPTTAPAAPLPLVLATPPVQRAWHDPGLPTSQGSAPPPARTVGPLGPMRTSLQRSMALPGPGRPLGNLTVRPAGTPTTPALLARAVQPRWDQSGSGAPLQRVTTGRPLPPTPSTHAQASPAAPALVTDDAQPLGRTDAQPLGRTEESAPGPVARRPLASGGPAAAVAAAAAVAVPTGREPAAGTVQLALDEDATPDEGRGQELTASAVPSGSEARSEGADTPVQGTETTSPEQVEALAQRLIGPLLRRITAQLLIDRERHGSRVDAW